MGVSVLVLVLLLVVFVAVLAVFSTTLVGFCWIGAAYSVELSEYAALCRGGVSLGVFKATQLDGPPNVKLVAVQASAFACV